MIEIIDRTEHSILEISIIGTLTKVDFEQIDDFFADELMTDAKLNVLLLMDDWDGIKPSGLVEDMKLAKYVKNVKKAALVSDSEFLNIDAQVENLFPEIQVKYFPSTKRLDAENWLTM